MKRSPSLLRHLLAWTLGALFVVWAAFMVFGYLTGIHESDELTDGHLASVASILLAQRASGSLPAPAAASLGGLAPLKAHDYQQSLSIVVWDAAGRVLSRSGTAPLPAFDAHEGFATLTLGNPPESWRVFSRWDEAEQGRKVMVMLNLAERDELAQDIAEQVATPGLWLLPVVALALVLAVRRGLRPLLDLSQQVNALDVHRDSKLQAPPPHEEFQAIVQSIDRLMARYNAVLAHERELASEVAHELRTPLAALRLHAASLSYELSAEERAETNARIAAEAEHAGAVLTDLLALARASRTELAQAREPMDLAGLARRVTAEFGQTALQSEHELSVEAPEHCPFSGHPVLMELALRNLIENALAHTPPGTAVRVVVRSQPLTLEVIDNGASGQAAAATVTPPTRRHLGLGLGHQVVRRVAEIHQGRFEVLDLEGAGERSYRLAFEETVRKTPGL